MALSLDIPSITEKRDGGTLLRFQSYVPKSGPSDQMLSIQNDSHQLFTALAYTCLIIFRFFSQ